jgi:peptidoglycan hydrolase-like protein with peptidoglycan-binding domain
MIIKSLSTRATAVAFAVLVAVAPLAAFASVGYGGVAVGGGTSGGFGPGEGASGSSGQVLGASVYNFTVEFGYGTRDEDATQLQTILIADGYLHIAAPTGWYGPLTRAAVMEYQAAHGISPLSGYVGPLTLASLNQGTVPTTPETTTTTSTGI